MQEQTIRVLNAYLEAELGRSLFIADAELIAGQRANFLREFGPQRLNDMDGAALLQQLPSNRSNDQPMDYWLEFRSDEIFNQRLFGSISGGSAAKFGTWQDKKTGRWRAKSPGSPLIRDITEDQALAIVEHRRREILATVQALQAFATVPVWEIDPQEVQAAMATAAPRWHASAWLHKYLHLVFPELATASATLGHLQANLYRVGERAAGGMYACDVRIIQFWSSLPALAQVPVSLRYRLAEGLAPRDHWYLVCEDEGARRDLLAGAAIALGPAQLGNLGGLFSLTRRTEVRKGMEIAFQTAGLADDVHSRQDLVNLGHAVRSASLVALLSDTATVEAVGEVIGSYRYGFRATRPHQIPVRWLHRERFRLSSPVVAKCGKLIPLPPQSPQVAELEAALLSNGVGFWPQFSQAAAPRVRLELLPPAPGIIGELLDMLERKHQVVLYGPPGTGKTYYAQRIALEMIARHNYHCLPSQLSAAQRERIDGRDGNNPLLAFCTFHPAYGYEDFIEGYRPEPQGFTLKSGLFKRLAAAAQTRPGERFVLIIDEINRGNIPKIFGELISLLEPSKRGSLQAYLPLSGDLFSVPSNLYIIATMNTADRSILLLDTALRRRFGFRELLPMPELLRKSRIGGLSLAAWLKALNRRIREQLGRDGRNLQVGHAYFMPEGEAVTAARRIAAIIREDIWPLLQEYCYEDPQTLAAILAADKGGIYDRNAADLRHEFFEPGREEDLAKALAAIVSAADREVEAAVSMLSTQGD